METRLVEIGYIQRTHGINGEVQLALNDTLDENPESFESVFLEIEGIPTPFFVEYIRQKSDDKIIAKFEDFDSLNAADGLVGFKVLLPLESLPVSDDVELKDLVGYTLFSESNQLIGEIASYTDFGLNAVYGIKQPNSADEVLIPASDDLIVEFDQENHSVIMSLPEGLFDTDYD